jgi:hypothetical protein
MMPGRSHIITNEAGTAILRAMEERRHFLKIGIELNGEGSGLWNVTINTSQVIALVEHPEAVSNRTARVELRVVADAAHLSS